MFRFLLSLLFLLLFSSGLQAHPVLAKLDQLRLGSSDQAVKVITEIRLYKKGELDSQRDYEVYVGSERRSLVLFRSPSEAGQKMLMLDDQYWLFMPSSRRPLRITPMQKLLGEASSGDLSSLRWKDDYTVISEDRKGEQLQLQLEAARSGVTYAKVELLVEAASLHPQEAAFYLQSGRLAREAEFLLEERQGRTVISGMELQDRIQQDEHTVILYHSSEPVEIPDRWFNPAFLSRETL